MSHQADPRPLRVMFLLTSMPIGGAETLLVNLVRSLDRARIEPLVACLKHQDELGELLAAEIPVFDHLINHKYDLSVTGRLKNLLQDQQIDALVTVGAGDKMFWGRIAARRARIPVILSALHSTGWPDGVGRLNRMLTGITDGFIAVAKQHADYQIHQEKFPAKKVFLIPNGIDTERFVYSQESRICWRTRLGISELTPVVGIVAALRPEKNHDLFLEAARRVAIKIPDSQFVIIGDGPERERLQKLSLATKLGQQVHFLGSTQDVSGVLSMMDLFSLTSHNEASPVSIMEALACQRPVVATDVGSIDESVLEAETGFLVPPGDAERLAYRWIQILEDRELQRQLGANGRQHIIQNSSIMAMTEGYTALIENLFYKKRGQPIASDTACVNWGDASRADNFI